MHLYSSYPHYRQVPSISILGDAAWHGMAVRQCGMHKNYMPVGLARRSGPVGNLLTGQKTLTGQIGDGNEVAGVKVGKFRERVHNFASTDQMEATNSAK